MFDYRLLYFLLLSLLIYSCEDDIKIQNYDLCTQTNKDDGIFEVNFEGVSTDCKSDPVVVNFDYTLSLDSLIDDNMLYIHLLSEQDYLVDSSFAFFVDCGFGDTGSDEQYFTKLLEKSSLEDKGHISITEEVFEVYFSFETEDCLFTETIEVSTFFERP